MEEVRDEILSMQVGKMSLNLKCKGNKSLIHILTHPKNQWSLKRRHNTLACIPKDCQDIVKVGNISLKFQAR